jgi:hypothetical protein
MPAMPGSEQGLRHNLFNTFAEPRPILLQYTVEAASQRLHRDNLP